MTRRFLIVGLLLGIAVLGIGLSTIMRKVSTAIERRPAIALHECQLPDVGEARCGTLDVFENRETRTGRKIGINVVVVPARSGKPAAEPVFWFEGGPGGAATRAIGPVSTQYLSGLRDDRDLVFV